MKIFANFRLKFRIQACSIFLLPETSLALERKKLGSPSSKTKLNSQ
jgi:hypothetical protein